MRTCHACQADVTVSAQTLGRCAKCGAALGKGSQRKSHDLRDTLYQELTAAASEAADPTASPNPTVPAPSAESGGLETIDVGTVDLADVQSGSPSVSAESNPDTMQTLDLPELSATDASSSDSAADPPAGSQTVALAGEQTVDFSAGDFSEPELASLVVNEQLDQRVTTQWQENLESPADSSAGTTLDGASPNLGVTIKQKETVHSDGAAARSSLVVKSRHVSTPQDEKSLVMSAADSPDYELLDVIGEGGMGVVYSARQSSIARTVAVKMLKGTDAPTQAQREKFISEAVVTGELDHPNIVPIYDLGTNDEGALFYSMKRVRGTPWEEVFASNGLDENLNILLRVADAIAFAHANGVLHRDLKPENVMLGDFGEVLVMDWGLARISPEFPNADAVSQSDVMGGTPAYMAPEMATGPVDQISIASDIYLLGAILFEIITGKPPHSGKTVMACLLAAAKNTLVETEVSGELMDIAMRAMATRPADRFATVQAFQAEVRQYQSHSESILLTESASKNLVTAIEADDYDRYSRAVHGFEEALSLWSGNARAQELLTASRGAYAQAALDRSDFDLGISLLDAEQPLHSELLEELLAGRSERESRNRRLTLMKRAVATLLLIVVGTVSLAYFAVRAQRNEAFVQRDRADANYLEAETARASEEVQRKEAQSQRSEAIKQRTEAEKQKGIADQQRDVALRAKQAEAYEAYVARIGLANAKIAENAFHRAVELLDECAPALRQWEWGRLSHLCHLSVESWQVDGPAEAVAIAPNGRTFVSGDWAGQVKLWDLQSGQVLATTTHGQYVHAVAFDASGARFATASSDHTIQLYQASTGQLLQTLAGHQDAVVSVRFSADGKRLLSSSFDNTARLWDLQSGTVEQTLTGHSWWVWAAEFSPDNRQIVTVSQDGKAMVWQLGEDALYGRLTEFSQHRGPIYAAQFSPDGLQVATAGYDRRVLLWSPAAVEPTDIARRVDHLADPPAPYRQLAQHDGAVRTLAFSPDGNWLVSGGQDNVLRVWDFSSDRQRTVMRGHASHVRDCVFSPDGKLLLSAGRDQQIKLWEPATYGETFVLQTGSPESPPDAVLASRFSRDGKQIVTASRDRTATLWDTERHARLQNFAEGHDFLASSAVFFADGTRLATGGGDGTVRIWDVARGTELLKLAGTGRTAALAVSADGQWIATGSDDNDVALWHAQTGEQVLVLPGHLATVTALAFAENSRQLASGDELGRCRLWQLDEAAGSWTAKHELRGHSRLITALAFARGGKRLISASGDNTCGQWDVASGQELRDLVLTHPDWVTDMTVSADGRHAVTACDDGVLRWWSLEEARVLRELARAEATVFTSVDLSPEGSRVLAASAVASQVTLWDVETGIETTSADGAAWMTLGAQTGTLWAAGFAPTGEQVLTIGGNDARLWEIASRREVRRFSPHGAVASADLSPDGRLLVTGSWDRSAKIWEVASGKAVRKLDGLHQGYVNSVEFSPDGATILTASDDGTARLWDVATGSPAETVFAGHQARVRQARFSGDGQRVLTVGNDKTARIWDRQTGAPLQVLSGHQWAVLCGDFSSDGSRVVTGSEDNTARIWDASTGAAWRTLAGHTDSVTSVAFSPDGQRVMTASLDSTAKLWDAVTGKEILTLVGHHQELTAVSFSPSGDAVLTSSRDGSTILWPAADWRGR